MANLPAMQNQYVEFAKNDSNGDKIDIKALNTAIEEAKENPVIPTTLSINTLTSTNEEITSEKPIIQPLSDFTFAGTNFEDEYRKVEYLFAGVERNGNKITFSLFYSYIRKGTIPGDNIQSRFNVPAWFYNQLVSTAIGGVPCVSSFLSYAASSYNAGVSMPCIAYKNSGTFGLAIEFGMYKLNANLELNTTYYVRHEVTFLIGDNMIN